MQIKRNEILKVPTLFFVVGIFFYATWGAYYQFFSQFPKITFNNVVPKFAKFCNFLKICEKNSQYFLRKCMREKLLIKLSAIQILINAENS